MLPDSTTFGFIILLMIAFFALGSMVGSFIGETRGWEKGFAAGKSVERARSGAR